MGQNENKPSEYIPLQVFIIYSVILSFIFLLVDKRIIEIG